jgi:formylglycine-generating enzyme required for sulfatase activity
MIGVAAAEISSDTAVAAAVEALDAAGQPHPADEPESQDAAGKRSAPPGLEDTVRRAGELVALGDPEKARYIILRAMRECDAGKRDVRECSQWAEPLRGLSLLLESPPERKVITNSIGMRLVRIPAGEYMMGSLKAEMDWLRLTFRKTWREGHKQWFQDELPLHPVRITRPYYIGATEVTVGQFRKFVRETKYKTDGQKGDGGMVFSKTEGRWVPDKRWAWDSVPWKIYDDQPVVFVSWKDANAFCKWLSRKEKRTYRLPTEAEWERACRGGRIWARFPWGERLPGDKDTNFGDGNPKLPESLTTVNDGYEYVSPVGSYPPNGYGLYDMAGNVMEWVRDGYDRNYYESSPLEDPQGTDTGTSHVNKGGNFFAGPSDCRCAFRGFSGEEMNFFNLGFRVVLEVRDSEKPKVASKDSGSRSRSDEAKKSHFPPSEEEGLRLFRQAMFAAQQQQWREAVKDLEAALKVYEKRRDLMWMARVRATLAGIYAERNRRYKSKELFTKALAEFRKVGDGASARIILERLQELDTSPGVKVVEVKKGGIADRAGVVPGDVIIEYAGETGFKVRSFKSLVNDYSRADKVTLSVLNNDEISTTVVSGGSLGVAVENIKRKPRPRRRRERRPRRRRRQRDGNRDRR